MTETHKVKRNNYISQDDWRAENYVSKMLIGKNTDNCILVLGSAGYIGAALMHRLSLAGYRVFGIDNGLRERNVEEIGGRSLTSTIDNTNFKFDIVDDYYKFKEVIMALKPKTIVNLAQQPSAPFSMIDAQHATETQKNNIIGGLNVLWVVGEIDPDIHIIQLGTTGEFSDWLYPSYLEVPEGPRVTIQKEGKDWTIPTPRYGGSLYHMSKTHSSMNADYLCRTWGLKVTDINQGIVYGHIDGTRFDYDQYFGTVINRFVVQAVAGIPLTVYGTGGQNRAMIHILNSIQAIELLINNPPEEGYRTIHQLTDTKSILDIAKIVQSITGCEIQFIKNPRVELPENQFNFEAAKLKSLGLKPVDMETEIKNLVNVVTNNKGNIRKEVIMPTTLWKPNGKQY